MHECNFYSAKQVLKCQGMAVGGYQGVVKCICVSLEQTTENVSLGTSQMCPVLWTRIYAVLFIN